MAGAVIGLVVGWVSAGATATNTSRVFEATNTLILVRQVGGDTEAKRVNQVLTTLGPVPARVAARLGIDRQQVQAMVSADGRRPGVLSIIGRSTDRSQAEALANVTAEELIVELGGQSSPLQVLEPAVASPATSGPILGPSSRRARALLLGAFGLFLGVGAALAVERFDDNIRSKRAAEEALGFPVVVEVPEIPRSDRDRLLTGAQPSPFIEAHRRLRTTIDRWVDETAGGPRGRLIVVTSPMGGEGKTSTVAHLATTLAEVGRSVLVISADLRKPKLHLYFDRPREPGLADLLRSAPDAHRLSDLRLVTAIRGVSLVASGAPVEDAAPFFERIGEELGSARDMADIVLVDVPPLLTTSDGADLARHADGVLLVVRAGQTSVGASAQSAELLQRLEIPVIGAVLIGGHGLPSVQA